MKFKMNVYGAPPWDPYEGPAEEWRGQGILTVFSLLDEEAMPGWDGPEEVECVCLQGLPLIAVTPGLTDEQLDWLTTANVFMPRSCVVSWPTVHMVPDEEPVIETVRSRLILPD